MVGWVVDFKFLMYQINSKITDVVDRSTGQNEILTYKRGLR